MAERTPDAWCVEWTLRADEKPWQDHWPESDRDGPWRRRYYKSLDTARGSMQAERLFPTALRPVYLGAPIEERQPE